MIGRILQVTAIPSPADGGTRLVFDVLPMQTNKDLSEERVPRPNEVIQITVIGRPLYVTGHDEDGNPQWDLSAPENR